MPIKLLVLACFAWPVAVDAQHVRVRIGIPGHAAPVAVDSLASVFDIDASSGATFSAVETVLKDLKVPIDSRDSVRGLIGNMQLPKLRSFAGSPISRFLNCGSGITGANADNWRVYITAIAFIDKKDAATSTLRVAMVGGAQDIQGSSKDPVACGSTGGFESLLVDRVKKVLAAARS
ncbi:MAG: hypothetical protein ABIZ91_15890 [Gemmatimonadaceae bacterium]